MDVEHFADPNLSVVVGCCEMLVFRVCGARQNSLNPDLYLFSLNPDLDHRIFDCLLTSMAAVQAEDVRASFLFADDLNGHHQEWLGSTTTNRRGFVDIDFTWLRLVGCRSDPSTWCNT